MTVHIHLGGMDFLKVSAYVIIFAYIWKTIAAHFSHTAFGRAMGYIL